MSELREGSPNASRRPRMFAGRSLRGLLDVMPSQDLSFYGITVGWKGVGLIVARRITSDRARRRSEGGDAK